MLENTLFYHIKDLNPTLSGFRRKFLTESIENIVKTKIPKVNLFETSPRAVIEGEF